MWHAGLQTGEADKGTARAGGRRKGFRVPPVQSALRDPEAAPRPKSGEQARSELQDGGTDQGRRQVMGNHLGVCLHLQQPGLSHPCVLAPGTMHAAQSNTLD